jgi:hypothetical protein
MDYLQLHSDIYFELASRKASAAALREIGERRSEEEPIDGIALSEDASDSAPLPIPAIHSPLPITHPFVGYLSSGWPVAYLVATVILGLGLTVGAIVHVSHPTATVVQTPPAAKSQLSLEERIQLVGRITGMVDCRWADPTTEAISGAYVPMGRRYALASGLMEITYDTGAKVLLQGPVTYEVESKESGYLAVGKLTAKLEKRSVASGQRSETPNPRSLIPNPSLSTNHDPQFAVRTPTAVVTDLGTEFGVEVSEQGGTVAHVFRGLVDVQPVSKAGKPQSKPIQLSANQSVVIEKANGADELTVRRTAIKPAGFVRCEQLPKLVEDQRLKPFRRWLAYSMELRRDPSLLAYYDFQQKEGEPRILANVAAHGNKSFDGVVENATWTTGRMTGKHALRFQTPDDHVQIDLPQKVDDLTLAAWVNVESLHDELSDGQPLFNGLLMSEHWNRPGQVHWQLDSEGRVCFGQFGIQEGRDARAWKSAPAFDQSRLRHWTHLAAVFEPPARVKFFVDGQLTGEDMAENKERIPICIGPAWIGMWNGAPRTFNGRIDELAVFGRALKSDEIRSLFAGGEPAGADRDGGALHRGQPVER